MTYNLLIFGMGYTASRLVQHLSPEGWRITGIRRQAAPDHRGANIIAYDDRSAILSAIQGATHILSSVPPDTDGIDPVLRDYGQHISDASLHWAGYLSSTGVYGDTQGAWVDEGASVGQGRRTARAAADSAWQGLRSDMRIFRLPGIYGPGRNMFDRIRTGRAHRIDMPDQIFSRIHVDDICRAIIASFSEPSGVYNIADDQPCSQNKVVEYACSLLGMPSPPLLPVDEAGLSPQALAFYAENRRIANGRAKRLLGWKPQYTDYRDGLRACLAEERGGDAI